MSVCSRYVETLSNIDGEGRGRLLTPAQPPTGWSPQSGQQPGEGPSAQSTRGAREACPPERMRN